MLTEKDPRLVESGKRGAEKRWGPARRPYIGDLPERQRRLILAAIAAEREKAQNEMVPAVSETPAGTVNGQALDDRSS